MAKSVKINGVTYNDVKAVEIPLASDPSTIVVYPNTDDATAVAESVKDGDTFYANGKKHEGSMPVHGAGGGVISDINDVIDISKGFYDGTGSVRISDVEKAKAIPNNIRAGITFMGIPGAMTGSEDLKAQSKTVTPTKSDQAVLPDSGYNALAQVTVKAIPAQYITTDDATAEAGHIAKDETAYVNGKKVVGTHTDPTFTLTNGILSIK